MCVVIYKKAGVPVPSEDTIRACFRANPDGAGIGIRYDSGLRIRKGFMQVADFTDALRNYSGIEHQQLDIIYHFRIGTSGGSGAGQCHPFPVTSPADCPDVLMYQSLFLDTESDWIFAHNGVFGSGEGELSDSQVYVRDVLTPLLPLLTLYPENAEKIVAATGKGSKVILMPRKGPPILTGEWHTDKDTNLLFSNLHFRSSFSFSASKGYSDWWNDVSDAPSEADSSDVWGKACSKKRGKGGFAAKKSAFRARFSKKDVQAVPLGFFDEAQPCPACGESFIRDISILTDLYQCELCGALVGGDGQERTLVHRRMA
jgi:hypothetical protein